MGDRRWGNLDPPLLAEGQALSHDFVFPGSNDSKQALNRSKPGESELDGAYSDLGRQFCHFEWGLFSGRLGTRRQLLCAAVGSCPELPAG
jgi:hypothetical protein